MEEDKWTEATKMLEQLTSIARDLKGTKVSEVLYKYDQVMEYHRLLKIMAINDLRIRIRKKGSREIRRRRERSARWKYKAAKKMKMDWGQT